MLALFLAIALLGTDSAYGRSIIDLTGANHDNTDLGGSELYAKAGAYDYGDDDPIDLTAAKVNLVISYCAPWCNAWTCSDPDCGDCGLDHGCKRAPSANPDLTGLEITAESSIGLDPSRPSPSATPASPRGGHYPSCDHPGTCPATFTSTAALKTAVQAYNTDPAAAIATYGLIADWDVSAVTDMSYLFYNLKNLNADISNWDTSSVTDMSYMFYVRSARALPPKP